MSCFILQNNEVSEYNTSADISPCGPVNATTAAVPCCTNGDACLTGGLCFFTFSLTGGSGYYAAGCTDSSFRDPHCREICYDQPALDVTYDASSGLWDCCGGDSNGPDCPNPTNETFNLAAPSDLATYFQIPATGYAYTSISGSTSTPTASTSTGSPTSTSAASGATSPPAPTGSHSNGISKGAAAGIGVGAAAAVAIAAASTWFILRAWRRRRSTADGQDVHRQDSKDGGNQGVTVNPYPPAYGNPELSVDRNALELQA